MISAKRAIKVLTAFMATGALTAHAYIEHQVKRSETLWGVAHKYNVSPDDIVKLNPKAASGINEGMVLMIPGQDENSDSGSETVSNDNATDTPQPRTKPSATATAETPGLTYRATFGDTFEHCAEVTGVSTDMLMQLNPQYYGKTLREGDLLRLSDAAPFTASYPVETLADSIIYNLTPAESRANAEAATTIAVMLPFDLTHEEVSRQSAMATDFYKGLLLSLKDNSKKINSQIRIIAVDTQCDEQNLHDQLDQLESQGAQLIIMPDNDRQIDIISEYALAHNIPALNVLSIKNEAYLTRPNVVQFNISQERMYDKALEAIAADYGDYIPVILNPEGGKNDKASFISQLRGHCRDTGKQVIELNFADQLTTKDLERLDDGRKYLLVPQSGSAEVFRRFSEALGEYLGNETEFDRVKLFGYPEWIAFRGESEEQLHQLGAMIYSRFYYDENDFAFEDFNKKFDHWYDHQLLEVFPSQGMLGYDTGDIICRALGFGDKLDLIDGLEGRHMRGTQSAFNFVKQADASGLVNDSLYWLEFLPGGSFSVKVL